MDTQPLPMLSDDEVDETAERDTVRMEMECVLYDTMPLEPETQPLLAQETIGWEKDGEARITQVLSRLSPARAKRPVTGPQRLRRRRPPTGPEVPAGVRRQATAHGTPRPALAKREVRQFIEQGQEIPSQARVFWNLVMGDGPAK